MEGKMISTSSIQEAPKQEKDVKDLTPEELIARVHELESRNEELKRRGEKYKKVVIMSGSKKRELRKLATIDELTQILNRRGIFKELDFLRDRILNKNRQDSLENGIIFFIDIDGFKQINDRHSHKFGDKVLKILAEKLKDILRRNDIVGRIGGDEFVIAIPESVKTRDMTKDDKKSIKDIIYEKIEGILREGLLIMDDEKNKEIRVYASFGYEKIKQDNGTVLTPEEVLNIADKKMYKNKETKS